MSRTAVNVTGDTVCAIWVAKSEGELELPADAAIAAT
jgi:Na+/H+-dicarboxylate symporter